MISIGERTAGRCMISVRELGMISDCLRDMISLCTVVRRHLVDSYSVRVDGVQLACMISSLPLYSLQSLLGKV
jgi:hypothetical protein